MKGNETASWGECKYSGIFFREPAGTSLAIRMWGKLWLLGEITDKLGLPGLQTKALQRFVNRQHLRKIHECVFGVLALESEPVDPRL